jgi:hypothetical protein
MSKTLILLLALAVPAVAHAGDPAVLRDRHGVVVGTVEPKRETNRLVVRDRAGRVTHTIERAGPRLDRRVVRDRAGRVVGTVERR